MALPNDYKGGVNVENIIILRTSGILGVDSNRDVSTRE